MDYLTIGPTPNGESCAQVGEEEYSTHARRECRAYINQLTRQFGEPPCGARFMIQSNLHDFGTYFEVVVRYDENDEATMNFAFRVESECPDNWDEEAKKELGLI